MSTPLAERRERQIDEMIQKLASSDPAERKEAALYLGEAAAELAVDKLVDLFENDEDRGVRRAAAYALGMFKSVEKELKRGEKSRERVVQLLEQVETHGKLGKRANKSGLYSSIALLIVLLAILGGMNLFLPNYLRTSDTLVALGAITRTPTPSNSVVGLINDQIGKIRADASTLTSQYETVRGGGIDCAAFFNNPPAIDAAQVAPAELAAVAVSLNSVLVDLISTRQPYDAACNNQRGPLTPADVDPYLPTLANALIRLNDVQASFEPFARYIPTQTPIPTATVDPFFTPSATPATPNPESHFSPLYELADLMIRPNGGAALLESYWQDVIRTGDTDGCRGRVPNIPAAYVLPDIDRAASPDLGQAVDLINSGLEAINTGWIDFTFACNSGNLRGAANRGVQNAQTAIAAFRTAVATLDQLRGVATN
ncbi:MAG: HEAT repeat domain-containing protein [bacterium]|nr:HEAT repeat domain-containing protein [bacterium]